MFVVVTDCISSCACTPRHNEYKQWQPPMRDYAFHLSLIYYNILEDDWRPPERAGGAC
jgi:hypothetical protein